MADDGILSQDEIDALIREIPEEPKGSPVEVAEEVSEIAPAGFDVDAITGFFQEHMDSAAGVLSVMLNKKVNITVQNVMGADANDLFAGLEGTVLNVEVDYSGNVSGKSLLIFEESVMAGVADILMGGDGKGKLKAWDELSKSAVTEAMKQVIFAATSNLAKKYKKKISAGDPVVNIVTEDEKGSVDLSFMGSDCIAVEYGINIEDIVYSKFTQVIDNSTAEQIGDFTAEPAPKPSRPQAQSAPRPSRKPSSSFKAVQFSPLSEAKSVEGLGNLGILMDVPMEISVELGRTKKLLKEILELGQGAIIELDKLSGEPVDILVNDRLIAKGEVIVIGENFGVRITDIVSPLERVTNL